MQILLSKWLPALSPLWPQSRRIDWTGSTWENRCGLADRDASVLVSTQTCTGCVRVKLVNVTQELVCARSAMGWMV